MTESQSQDATTLYIRSSLGPSNLFDLVKEQMVRWRFRIFWCAKELDPHGQRQRIAISFMGMTRLTMELHAEQLDEIPYHAKATITPVGQVHGETARMALDNFLHGVREYIARFDHDATFMPF